MAGAVSARITSTETKSTYLTTRTVIGKQVFTPGSWKMAFSPSLKWMTPVHRDSGLRTLSINPGYPADRRIQRQRSQTTGRNLKAATQTHHKMRKDPMLLQ